MPFPDPPFGPVALEDRRAARLAGKLNKPIGGPRWVKSMSNVERELPDGVVTAADRARWAERWRQDGHGEPQMGVEIVLTVLPSQPAPERARKAWRGRGRSGN